VRTFKTSKLVVLVLNNNFHGSYGSNQVFFSELVQNLKEMGIITHTASSIIEAVKIYKNHKIDFSISFGKYIYYKDNYRLYDLFKVPHFQWVSDNPLKMNMDENSKFITYIFIDDEFEYCSPNIYNPPLIKPLGFTKVNDYNLTSIQKKQALLMPCKIRSLEELNHKIKSHKDHELIKKFINGYDFDTSFIMHLKNFRKDYQVNEDFFRIVNEYIRVKKRIDIVNAINIMDVFIVGEDTGNFKEKTNVFFINPVDYNKISNLMSQYKIVINVDPNYHSCVHGRFIRSVQSNTLCLTNSSNVFHKSEKYVYSFKSLKDVDNQLSFLNNEYDDILAKQKKMISNYDWKSSINDIIKYFEKSLLS
jgi:hypothetical protein